MCGTTTVRDLGPPWQGYGLLVISSERTITITMMDGRGRFQAEIVTYCCTAEEKSPTRTDTRTQKKGCVPLGASIL